VYAIKVYQCLGLTEEECRAGAAKVYKIEQFWNLAQAYYFKWLLRWLEVYPLGSLAS
jgi:hypothetical protein